MKRPFDTFVMLAGMRTGSNLLEATLNLLPGVTCHGEAFNPVMIGYPKTERLLDMTRAERDADPAALLGRMRAAPGLNGFRYFHDHDPRIFDEVMQDRRCAKIVLTRNPAESWVSLQIARATGQWKLSDGRKRKTAQAEFDAASFESHLEDQQAFHVRILRTLQITAQTAFYIDYDDLRDPEVLNGLATWLGFPDGVPQKSVDIVPQNPEEIAAKVTNFPQMEASLARLDRFNLSRTPSFEPRRGPNVPSFVASDAARILFMPVRGTPEAAVRTWLQSLDRAPLTEDFSQKSLRQWMRDHGQHRRVTVVSHPLLRAHRAFNACILPGTYPEIRAHVSERYKAKLPPIDKVAGMGADAYRHAFMAFLTFLRANLNGQTPVRVDPFWASQAEVILGFTRFAPADMVFRESRLGQSLPMLAALQGLAHIPAFVPQEDDGVVALADIYDAELEESAQAAYPRDFLLFGHTPWDQMGQRAPT